MIYLIASLFAFVFLSVSGIKVDPGPAPISSINPCAVSCPAGQYCPTTRCVANCAFPPPIPPVTCANITCPPCFPKCVMANSPGCNEYSCKQGPVCVFDAWKTCKENEECESDEVCRMIYTDANCLPEPECIDLPINIGPVGPISKVTDRVLIPIKVPDPAGPVKQGGK